MILCADYQIQALECCVENKTLPSLTWFPFYHRRCEQGEEPRHLTVGLAGATALDDVVGELYFAEPQPTNYSKRDRYSPLGSQNQLWKRLRGPEVIVRQQYP